MRKAAGRRSGRHGLLGRAVTLLLPLAAVAVSAHAQYAAGYAAAARLRPTQIAVVVNEDLPESVELGEYYVRARHVPKKNLVRVRIAGGPRKLLTAGEFAQLKGQIEAKLDASIQALVLVWTAPYAVECNSITSALTLGFQAKLCENTCATSKVNPYFDAPDSRTIANYKMRLAMLLPTPSVEQTKALIDRGVQSDGSFPKGSAYFLETSDASRSIRARFFPQTGRIANPPLELHNLRADSIENKHDVMFYFTGAVRVANLETLQFLPGAVADHLTSAGGDLLGDGQMSSMAWLEAGATASYGTVSEPCNFWQKFPNPAVLLKHYLAGQTIIESYWKSVAWPAQGVFIGEPLASPYWRGTSTLAK